MSGDVRPAQARGLIDLASRRLAGRRPFHAHVLSQWKIEESSLIPTCAVTLDGGDVKLLFNPQFVAECSLDELAGVECHEVNHVLFQHLFMNPEDYLDREALTIAQELTANEHIAEPLPGHPYLLRDFPSLPADEDTVTRYRRLEQAGLTRPVRRCVDDHQRWPAGGASAGSRLTIKAIVANAVEKLTAEDYDRLPRELKLQINGMLAGNTAGSSALHLDQIRGGSVNWQVLLQRRVRRVLERQASYRRPPRRLPHLIGVIPGSSRLTAKPNVLAVIDTSGSMSEDMLSQISAELGRIARLARVVVIECDAKIQREYEYPEPLRTVRGRGGTDLRPPLQSDVIRRWKPSIVLVFTDGMGPAPDAAPIVPVIWCLTPNGSKPATWGDVIQLSA